MSKDNNNKRKTYRPGDETPYAPDQGAVHIMYNKQPKCPKCGNELNTISIKPHWFPYIHTDVAFECDVCDKIYTFGIPQSRDAGLSLHVFDSNPIGVVAQFGLLDDPDCAFGHGPMLKTKIFGDWIPEGERLEYQWKCAVCFLTEHKAYERGDIKHGADDGTVLSDGEEKLLRERLKAMGYIE